MKQFVFIVLLLFPFYLSAQQNEVSIVSTGEGKTKEEAINDALRNAVMQAYGVYVSANTQILDDEIVHDEIATISSGNVSSFEELSYGVSDSSEKFVTLKVSVSIGK